jgi:hypothetical protein
VLDPNVADHNPDVVSAVWLTAVGMRAQLVSVKLFEFT